MGLKGVLLPQLRRKRNVLTNQLRKLIAPIFRLYPLARGQWRIDQFLFKNMYGFSLSRDMFSNLYLLDLRNCIDRMLYVFGSFEKANILKFIEMAKLISPDIFLDLGANIGVYAITIGGGTDIPTVHAFEPDLDNNTTLRANILLNNLKEKVIVHDEALSDRDGRADLLLARDTGYLNTGKSSLTPQKGVEYEKAEIQTIRLDNRIQIENKVLLIKIDIEGHEESALLGMQRVLSNNKSLVQIEIFPENLTRVTNVLQNIGYRLSANQPPADHDYYFTNIEDLFI